MGLPERLVEQSTLTSKQLESLMSYLDVSRDNIKWREGAARRSNGEVTVGSYYRTVQQGRNKIRASMTTVLISIWMGLVKLEDVRRLFETVGKGGVELPEEEQARFVSVLNALLDKVVL